ncbi:MAG TPA: class I SAM-dependent methyltransferase [Chitinophagaceae bacterium]|jgi:2-polyprenyl-3-methyl-5-hydroxy-6-metoxy-1,4-benzoquinol methylase|nr:class I SAM-dependent methyltransferase [Chitinophagaceae bacterium]
MQKTCASYLCCKEEKKVLFEKKGYPILQCKQCGHQFVEIPDHEDHLSTVYSDDYFFEGKDGYPNYLNKERLLYKQGLRYAKLISKYTKSGKVLDIGSAAGFILKGFRDSGWICYGIEPNETMAAFGRKNLNLDIKTGSIETIQTNERFDLINMIQVIGHVYDLDKTLQNVTALLNKRGLVLVESWDVKSLTARMMGKNWHEYCPPSVVHWFSDATLSTLFKYYGFELIAKGHPLKKIHVDHAFSFLEGRSVKLIFKERLVRAMNRFIGKLTLIYPLRDVKWYIFRKISE